MCLSFPPLPFSSLSLRERLLQGKRWWLCHSGNVLSQLSRSELGSAWLLDPWQRMAWECRSVRSTQGAFGALATAQAGAACLCQDCCSRKQSQHSSAFLAHTGQVGLETRLPGSNPASPPPRYAALCRANSSVSLCLSFHFWKVGIMVVTIW